MAAQSAVSVEVAGLREVQDKMTQVTRDMAGPPMLEAMRDSTLLVVRDARKNAPVDTGRLRASIVPEVRKRERTIEGIVGSNVVYAPFQELGTKRMKGKFYLQRAIKSNLAKIRDLLSRGIKNIVEKK